MSLSAFLRQIQEDGRVQVAPPGAESPEDPAALEEALRGMDQAARLDLPDGVPDLSLPAACWAAGMLYQGCQFLAFRKVGAEAIRELMGRPVPEATSASVCYSVDLTLRWLPDLIRLARGAAAHDPLVEALEKLAREWPLSSVGLSGIEDVDLAGFCENGALRQLYVDRVLARRDEGRLKDERVREAARAACGAYEKDFGFYK